MKRSIAFSLRLLLAWSAILLALPQVPTFADSGAVHSGHAAPTATKVSPEEVLKDLKAGNDRFTAGKPRHPHEEAALRHELAGGQQPRAIVLSCSDSRVPPELVFDQGLGDLFVVRVAGNILGAAAVASIEYAIEHLGANLIVVMGHESCGAVKAAMTAHSGESVGSPDLDSLVATIQGNLDFKDGKPSRALASSMESDKTLRKPVSANVHAVAARLFERSKLVHKAVDEHHVRIVEAVYGLDSGRVDFTE